MTAWLLLLACSGSDPVPEAAPPPAPAPAEAPPPPPAVPDEPEAPDEPDAPEPPEEPEEADADAQPDEEPEAPTENDTRRPPEEPVEVPDEDGSAEADAEQPEPEPEPEPAGPVTYTLDAGASQLYVVVHKADTVGAAVSHDHVVEARGWSGTVTWDPDDLSACKVDISVPVAKLVNDRGAMRKAVGLEGELDDGQRDDIKDNMFAKDQLDASSHGTISFSATSCSESGGKVKVKGPLTIRGKASTVTATMTVDATPDGFEASGSFTSKHTSHGFDPFSAMFGALKNEDKLRFGVNVVGAPK